MTARVQDDLKTQHDPQELKSAIEKAFDYRGDVTITLKSGESVEGYVFDRKDEGLPLDQCLVRVIPKDGKGKLVIRYSDIACLEFTGRDTATGERYERWKHEFHK